MSESAEIVVVGGGLFGPAIAYGLARRGCEVALLDDGDDVLRAARGNFGLVWVQSKGMGMQRYQDWSRESAELYPDFAAELEEQTGIDVIYRRGGLHLLLGDEEVEAKQSEIDRMKAQAVDGNFACEIIPRDDAQQMVPELRFGNSVVGAGYCRYDGDVNPLKLLRALHAGFQASGGRYHPAARVENIRHDGTAFVAETPQGRFTAPKVVLAAGHGITRLAPMVGLYAPIRPQRGQILVTERAEARIPIPLATVRQTDEGSVQLGNSEEDVEFDDGTTLDVTRRIAARAVSLFPALAALKLVRSWGCIRVLTPDKCAIYDESEEFPGAYVATSHSGVTLAAVNARQVAPWISDRETPPGFDHFSSKRFGRGEDDVQAA